MRLRAAFMGSPAFAVPCLHALAERLDIRLVVTQPDRPAGRGRTLTPPAVKVAAEALMLPIVQPTKLRDGTLVSVLTEQLLDVIVVVAYGRILPADVLAIPRHGCINVHASLLPLWRGAAPIQRAVLAGDRDTGISIMQMEQGLDTGPVFIKTSTPIEASETAGGLATSLAALGAATLARWLDEFPNVAPAIPQDHHLATYAPRLEKHEGRTDWSNAAPTIVDHVRGMDPWPVAYTGFRGIRVRMFHAQHSGLARSDASKPGDIVHVDALGVHVACGEGVVVIAEMQGEGSKRMAARAFASGHGLTPGARFDDGSQS